MNGLTLNQRQIIDAAEKISSEKERPATITEVSRMTSIAYQSVLVAMYAVRRKGFEVKMATSATRPNYPGQRAMCLQHAMNFKNQYGIPASDIWLARKVGLSRERIRQYIAIWQAEGLGRYTRERKDDIGANVHVSAHIPTEEYMALREAAEEIGVQIRDVVRIAIHRFTEAQLGVKV